MSLRITSWMLIAFAFLLCACTSDNRTSLPDADFFLNQGQGFLLNVGDTAGIGTPSSIVLVRFNGVLDDSRCPVDVTCVQAGHATVLLTVQTALSIQDVTIEVPPGGNVEVVVEEVTVTALELRPAAEEGRTIAPLEYQVALVVVETGSLPVPTSP